MVVFIAENPWVDNNNGVADGENGANGEDGHDGEDSWTNNGWTQHLKVVSGVRMVSVLRGEH